MIISIRSTLESFKPVDFREGLNVLIAESVAKDDRGRTRNSVGKTSLIEIIHFLLGANCKRNSLLMKNELVQHVFFGKFKFGEEICQIGRTGSMPRRIYLVNGFEDQFSGDVPFDMETQRRYISNDEWKKFLNGMVFNLNSHAEESTSGDLYTPSFRNLFPYFARRAESKGFLSPEKHTEGPKKWVWQSSLSFLFGVDHNFSFQFGQIEDRKVFIDRMNREGMSDEFEKITGNTNDLKYEIAMLEGKIERRRIQLRNFQAHESYKDLIEKATNVKNNIQSATLESTMLSEYLDHLNAALVEESSFDSSRIDEIYESAGIELPNLVLRRLSDVKEFYMSVIRNRKYHLNKEIDIVQDRIAEKSNIIRKLDVDRRNIMKVLEGKGVLDDFMVFQEELGELDAKVSFLKKKFDVAELLENSKARTAVDRKVLYEKLRMDLVERKAIIERPMSLVSRFVAELYDDRLGKFDIVATNRGPDFTISIDGDQGRAIGNMKIFCFDMALLQFNAERQCGPGFLIHDSHLFDGVDERQIARALEIGAATATKLGVQYIVTMNSDIYQHLPFSDGFNRDDVVLATRLSDRDDTSGLFGFRFS